MKFHYFVCVFPSGNFGKVYSGILKDPSRDPSRERHVAIKTIRGKTQLGGAMEKGS